MKRRKPKFQTIRWERFNVYLAVGITFNPISANYKRYRLHPTKGWRPV